jgi:hypothetical protein|tara:strand:+ start:1431 stop:2066 length:636 start_codon:yes stop_codon:yes gene_type:complete
MCDPVTASALLVGTTAVPAVAAVGAGIGFGVMGTVGTAATAGLFGAGGAFSLATTLSTLGQIGSAAMQLANSAQGSAYAEYQSGMAGYRAQVNQNNALAARYKSQYDAETFERRFKLAMSGQGPSYATSGVVVNQDTPAMIADNTAGVLAEERLAILYGGNVAATAAEQGAAGERAASSAYRGQAGSFRPAGYIGAGTSLMAGAYRAGAFA